MTHKNILRVWCDVLFDRSRYDRILEYVRTHVSTIDEIIFFTQGTHSSIRPFEDIRRRLDFTAEIIKDLRARNYPVKLGIDVLCTIGHLDEYSNSSIRKDYDLFVFEDGKKHGGRLCPISPKTMEYIRRVYSYAASINPDTIHIDDDLHYGTDCRCPECNRRFAEFYPDTPDGHARFTRERICAILKHIETTVHAVNPNIILGWMTCLFGDDGLDYSDYVNALRGNGPQIVWRPGGGNWNDESISAMIAKVHSVGRQVSALPDSVTERYAEIENFPYAPLKKSVSAMQWEAYSYLGAGCTGTAYNFMGSSGLAEEYIPYIDSIDDTDRLARQIVEAAGCAPACGIGKPLPDFLLQNDVPGGDELYTLGLPPAYRLQDSTCTFMTAELARKLSDECIREVLSKGVMIDGATLACLNERGFGAYTGFSIAESPDILGTDLNERPISCLLERYLEHSLVPYPGAMRDVHDVFAWCDPTVSIVRTNEKAAYLSELLNYGGTHAGYASGIFENELGGRVYVSGYAAYSWCGTLVRSAFLKRIFRYLSRESIPAYVASFTKAALWSRGNALILVNLSTGPSEDVRLAVKTRTDSLTLTRRQNRIPKQEQIFCSQTDGEYRIFALGTMNYQDVFLLTGMPEN